MTGQRKNHVGTNIRMLRQQRRWTQEELAYHAQIDTSYLGQIERMQRSPTIGIIERIADALEVDCHMLLTVVRGNYSEKEGAYNTIDIPRRIALELKDTSPSEQIVYYKMLKLLRGSFPQLLRCPNPVCEITPIPIFPIQRLGIV